MQLDNTNETILLLGPVGSSGDINTVKKQTETAVKLTDAGWILATDHDELTATAPYNFASWEIAAAFVCSLGISNYTLEWNPVNAWDEDPVSWPVHDPARVDVEALERV